MSSRGFNGITIFKNGIPLGISAQALLIDMAGVDNIQAIKGSASITQGFATGRGGGLVNIVTKTPKFGKTFDGNINFRSSVWIPNGQSGNTFWMIRPTFDIWGNLNKKRTLVLSFRRGL